MNVIAIYGFRQVGAGHENLRKTLLLLEYRMLELMFSKNYQNY